VRPKRLLCLLGPLLLGSVVVAATATGCTASQSIPDKVTSLRSPSVVGSAHPITAHPTFSQPGPLPGASIISPLPDPELAGLPLGTKVLQRKGAGNADLNLIAFVGRSASVSLRWVCVGPGELRVVSRGTVLVGSDCAPQVSSASPFGATIPLTRFPISRWTLEAASSTRWRISATVR
jgi:hypothetical protein